MYGLQDSNLINQIPFATWSLGGNIFSLYDIIIYTNAKIILNAIKSLAVLKWFDFFLTVTT